MTSKLGRQQMHILIHLDGWKGMLKVILLMRVCKCRGAADHEESLNAVTPLLKDSSDLG